MIVRWPGKIKAGSVTTEIVQHHDWLPTFLAIAGDPDVVEKLKKGNFKANGKTFKNHIDGYNLVDFLTGKRTVGGLTHYGFGVFHIDTGPRRTWGNNSWAGAKIGKGNECDPPKATKDGSRHRLRAPSGGEELEFMWVAKENAWERFGGRRMAFPASYLAQHGWTYVGPVT